MSAFQPRYINVVNCCNRSPLSLLLSYYIMFNIMSAQFDIILYNKNLGPTRLISAPPARLLFGRSSGVSSCNDSGHGWRCIGIAGCRRRTRLSSARAGWVRSAQLSVRPMNSQVHESPSTHHAPRAPDRDQHGLATPPALSLLPNGQLGPPLGQARALSSRLRWGHHRQWAWKSAQKH